LVIGWGTKIQEDVNLGRAKVINHPNAIRNNRNKYKALEIMANSRDVVGNVKKFKTSNQALHAIANDELVLPVIGRRNYHQGGKGFWLCLTHGQVERAIADGAQYFQNYIDIKTEYRLHVFDGSVIKAVKKVEAASREAWTNQRKEKIMDYATKNDWNLDDDTIERVLGILVKEVTLPDYIVRSNKRGWKFSNVRVQNLSRNLKSAAINAVKALDLGFGAVDCAIDHGENAWIIEVNTGPGLQGTAFDVYVEAFRNKIAEIQRPGPARRVANAARRAVGAAPVGEAQQPENNQANVQVNEAALVHMMNAVNSPEEARRVLDLMAGR